MKGSLASLVRKCIGIVLFGMTSLVVTSTAHAQGSEFDGTWRLVMRELPDGKKLMPPEVLGIASYANGYRNLNVVWKTPDGKTASVSSMSKFSIGLTEYTETMLFARLVDPNHPEGGILDTSGATKTTPVKREGGKINYQLPFDPPFIRINGEKSTATLEGVFIDHWERIK